MGWADRRVAGNSQCYAVTPASAATRQQVADNGLDVGSILPKLIQFGGPTRWDGQTGGQQVIAAIM
jgi:hypothetical protein